jgi:predicted ATPase/class 3 adenylate cyclase
MEGTGTNASASLTILFTDIEGSTSLWVDYPDVAGNAVGVHDEIVSNAITERGGRIIKTTGDGFLASFTSARAGVEAAITAQLSLGDHAADLMHAAHVRMALHIGSVEERGGDLFGLAIHRCERIMSAASAGQVLVSSSAAAVLRDDLPVGAELIDLGDQRLRGIPGVERVYQLAHEGLRRDFPALATVASAPSNLPAELTSFIGRERELTEILSLMDDHRLVTLTGEGGAGKTRISVQVGATMAREFTGGVWFVGLESLRDPELVPERFASTLGLEERPDRSYEDLLVDHLRDKPALLIADNCEHVLESVAHLASTLLRQLPHLRILATSRQRLGVPGEIGYRVPSMSMPDLDADIAQIGRYEAVQLFVDRAGLALPSFALSSANASAIGRIVRQLDGIPLALELAAAKTAAFTPGQIADHLDDRFRLLSRGSTPERPRHQTLEAAIDWSFDLLPENERRLFASLSVFRGGFDLTAAGAVCGGHDAADEVMPMVAELVEKSLLVADVDVGRYRLLETMRRYAADRLVEVGGTAAVVERHAEYFIAFAEEAGSGLDGPEQAMWLAALEVERDNLRAALEWSVDHEPMALRLSGAIWRFWLLRGRPAEGRDWLEKALGSASGADDRSRVQALLGMGALASHQGDQETAQGYLDNAGKLAADVGDLRGAAVAASALAVIQHKDGNLPAAAALFRTSLEQARGASDLVQVSRVLTNLALVLADMGAHEEAAECAREALEISRSLGIPDLIADAMLTTAEILINRGETAEAKRLVEEALRQSTETGVEDITAWALAYLGKLSLHTVDLTASRTLLGEAVAMFRTMESPMGEEWALRHLAIAELRSGEVGGAMGTAREALRLAVEFVRPDAPHVFQVAGQVVIAAGMPEDGVALLAAARRAGSQMELRSPPFEAAEMDAAWGEAASSLSAAAFDAACSRGASLGFDEVVELALSVLGAPSRIIGDG